MSHFRPATEEELIEALGPEADEESYFDDEIGNTFNVIPDNKDYNPIEDYNKEECNYAPSRAQSSARNSKEIFIDSGNLSEFSNYIDNQLKSKSNLPSHFPLNPSPLQYFSLL